MAARLGRFGAAFPRQPVPAGVAAIPHLFRIGHRKNHRARHRVAKFYGHGPVLSEWAAAYLDCVVCASLATLVSCGYCGADACP